MKIKESLWMHIFRKLYISLLSHTRDETRVPENVYSAGLASNGK